jgi:hypothetical protein
MTQVLPGWSQPDNFRKAPHQRLVDKVNEGAAVTPPDGQDYYRTPKGSGLVDTRPRPTIYEPILVSIAAAATPGGVYTGNKWDPPEAGEIDPDAADPPVKSDVGSVGDEIVILNRHELGMDTHDLIGADEEPIAPGVWEGVYLLTNLDGREVYTIDAEPGLPPPGQKFMVLSLVDDALTIDWDWPRAHA